jgi:hypothetical protein
MGQIPPKILVMAKKQATPKICVIQGGICLVQYESKAKTVKKIQSLNSLGENNLEGVQNPSQKDHLLIITTCVGMLT